MCFEKWDLKWNQLLDLTIMEDYISHLTSCQKKQVAAWSFQATETYCCSSDCNNKMTVSWNKPNNANRWLETRKFLKKIVKTFHYRGKLLHRFFSSHCTNCGRCASLFICASVGNPRSNVWSLSKVNVSRYEMLFWLAASSNSIF